MDIKELNLLYTSSHLILLADKLNFYIGRGVESLIPNINYDSVLNILNAMMNELYEDLPELRYYAIKEGDLSGKANRLLLAGAIDRANEALENFIAGMIRVNQIALTLGKYWGIFVLNDSYEYGDFEHEIITPDLFQLDESEKAVMLRDLTTSGLALATSLRMLGYGEEFIVQALEEKQNQETVSLNDSQMALGTALSSFNSGG